MKVETIPFYKTGYFSKLICDYLAKDDKLQPFYNNFPSIEGFKKQLEEYYGLFNWYQYDLSTYIEVASRLQLTAVPVLDSKNNYLGAITMNEMIDYVAQLSALNQPGGILVLELNENDYSMSQIAQIIESNDAKILSLYVKTFENSTKVELTLKINRTDLTSIMQTFERYDYTIKASYMHDKEIEELYENRYESFLKYLSI